MLATGALLITQTLRELRRIDLGFNPAGVSAHYLGLDDHGYTRERAALYYDELLSRLRTHPAVRAASLSGLVPFGSNHVMQFRLPAAEMDPIRVLANDVDDSYFDLLQTPVVQGRSLTKSDQRPAEAAGRLADGTPVVLSESLAHRLFGSQDPIRQVVEGDSEVRLVVSGVVRDVHWNSLVEAPEPFAYLPFAVRDYRYLDPVLLVRSTQSSDEIARLVAETMRALDPTMPPRFSTALTTGIERDGDLANRIVFASALSLLGGFGFALAFFGLAGLLSAIVWERTREFGVRLAIGASARHLVVSGARPGRLDCRFRHGPWTFFAPGSGPACSNRSCTA